MNVRLDSVIANIVGLTGQRILRAIVDGERDPERLAALRHRGVKADADTIAASLQGTWREEHLFALEQAMQRYDFLNNRSCPAVTVAALSSLAPAGFAGVRFGDRPAGVGLSGALHPRRRTSSATATASRSSWASSSRRRDPTGGWRCGHDRDRARDRHLPGGRGVP